MSQALFGPEPAAVASNMAPADMKVASNMAPADMKKAPPRSG
jgi:hypothetical protein